MQTAEKPKQLGNSYHFQRVIASKAQSPVGQPLLCGRSETIIFNGSTVTCKRALAAAETSTPFPDLNESIWECKNPQELCSPSHTSHTSPNPWFLTVSIHILIGLSCFIRSWLCYFYCFILLCFILFREVWRVLSIRRLAFVSHPVPPKASELLQLRRRREVEKSTSWCLSRCDA